MAADTLKCPHCFGDKPAAAKVCLHCGRDEQGFGPMLPSTAVRQPGYAVPKKKRLAGDLRIHVVIASIVAAVGFLIMLSSGLGALLFIVGVVWLLTTKARIWWRQQQ